MNERRWCTEYACSFFPTSDLGLDLGLGFFFQARTASETLVKNRQVIGRSRCAHYITAQAGQVPRLFSGPSKGPGADLSSGH
jgi:hypothetical protein